MCSFRAPDQAHFEDWQRFRDQCKSQGMDICRVVFFYIQAHLTGTAEVKAPGLTINLQQNNTFSYEVQKSRREPYDLNCSPNFNQRTISSMAHEALVMEHARELPRSFSYRDFPYLSHNSFRKIVLRLRSKGKIVPLPHRTNPRYYVLAERLSDYATVPENNRVRPM